MVLLIINSIRDDFSTQLIKNKLSIIIKKTTGGDSLFITVEISKNSGREYANNCKNTGRNKNFK